MSDAMDLLVVTVGALGAEVRERLQERGIRAEYRSVEECTGDDAGKPWIDALLGDAVCAGRRVAIVGDAGHAEFGRVVPLVRALMARHAKVSVVVGLPDFSPKQCARARRFERRIRNVAPDTERYYSGTDASASGLVLGVPLIDQLVTDVVSCGRR